MTAETPAAAPVVHYPEEVVALDTLRPHPKNYRHHPEDQLAHLRASLLEHGVYRNVVIAADGTLLAGHGVVEAARSLGLTEIAVKRTPYSPDDSAALKILAADNEIPSLAQDDEQQLVELLRVLAEEETLLGSGFDDASAMRRIVAVDYPEETDAWNEWRNMPDYTSENERAAFKVIVHFQSHDDADAFFKMIEQPRRASMWWPQDDGKQRSSQGEGRIAWVDGDEEGDPDVEA